LLRNKLTDGSSSRSRFQPASCKYFSVCNA
jgi:hypothetical protein